MSVHASLSLRWARAATLGVVALGTGTVAHAGADGLLPGPTGMVVLAVLCTALAAAFLGRQASTTRLVALVVGGQSLVHTGLAAMAGHRGDPVTSAATTPRVAPTPVPGPRTGSYYEQWAQSRPVGGEVEPVVPAWLVHAFADLAGHPVMALAHVLAAVAVGLWLAVGERALWAVLVLTAALALALVRRLHDALTGGPVAVPVPGAAARRAAYARLPIPRRPAWSHPLTRRGPPALLTAA